LFVLSTRIPELFSKLGDFCFQCATLLVKQGLAIGLLLFEVAQILGKFLKSLIIGIGYCAGGMMSVNQALQTPKPTHDVSVTRPTVRSRALHMKVNS
jgi:hypothetical protein